MEWLNVFDYRGVSHETDVPVSDVQSLYVVVLTGDELVLVTRTDGSQERLDAVDFMQGVGRADDFFDGDYGVHKDDLERWMKRKDSYEWFGVLKGGVLDAEM